MDSGPDWEGLLYLFVTGLSGVAIEWLRRRVLGPQQPTEDTTGSDNPPGA